MSTGDNYLRDQIGGGDTRCPGSHVTPSARVVFPNKRGRVKTVQATVVAKEKIRNKTPKFVIFTWKYITIETFSSMFVTLVNSTGGVDCEALTAGERSVFQKNGRIPGRLWNHTWYLQPQRMAGLAGEVTRNQGAFSELPFLVCMSVSGLVADK